MSYAKIGTMRVITHLYRSIDGWIPKAQALDNRESFAVEAGVQRCSGKWRVAIVVSAHRARVILLLAFDSPVRYAGIAMLTARLEDIYE